MGMVVLLRFSCMKDAGSVNIFRTELVSLSGMYYNNKNS